MKLAVMSFPARVAGLCVFFSCSLLLVAHTLGDDASAPDVDSVVTLLDLVLDADEATARKCLGVLTAHVQSRSLPPERVQKLKAELGERLRGIVADADHPLRIDAALLVACWGDRSSLELIRRRYLDAELPIEQRLAALQGLVAAGAAREVLNAVSDTINDPKAGSALRMGVIERLSGIQDEQFGPMIAELLVDNLPRFEEEVRPKAIEVLTQRPAWSAPLLVAIKKQDV
ncbi:MAG: hypothetical protein KDA58_05810, partial [Planctomycetaceae bacterium]|nr:hypothetical protein [Planctomycetaceae bacterium]